MSARRLPATLEVFCREYVKDLNGADAWKRSHPKTRTDNAAAAAASRALRKVKVQERIAELQASHVRASELTVDRVLEEIAALAFSRPEDVVVTADGTLRVRPGGRPDALRAVSQVERTFEVNAKGKVVAATVKVRLWSKPQALEMAARHLALFRESAPQAPSPYDFSTFSETELQVLYELFQRARRPPLLLSGSAA